MHNEYGLEVMKEDESDDKKADFSSIQTQLISLGGGNKVLAIILCNKTSNFIWHFSHCQVTEGGHN